MKPKKPAAVLVHGLHLQTEGWERLVWGIPGLTEVGRIPRAIEVALKEDAELLMWGTGASVDEKTGLKESEYTQKFALDHVNELAAYTGRTVEEITRIISQRSVLQLETTNTKNETAEALSLCAERGINTLYLVSSPTHVPRCLLTAIQLSKEPHGIVLCGVPADTSTEHWQPKDVAVVEPSHRPDRDESPFNLLAKRMASARKYEEEAPVLYRDIEKCLDEFDRRINKDS